MVAQVDSKYFHASPGKSLARLFVYALVEGRPLTTKGRWINPLVFAIFSMVKLLPQLKKVKEPIYILGTGRSGSTFLGNVLSLHPDVCYLNEPKALWHSAYPFEDVIGNYTEQPASFRLDINEATEDVINNARKLYAYALAFTGNNRILDKHGELIFRADFIKSIFPDAKFIFLIRDGRDTVASVARWSELNGSEVMADKNDWWGVNNRKWDLMLDELVSNDKNLGQHIKSLKKIGSQADMAAVEWVMTMKEGCKLLNDYPESSKIVRYEDVLSDTNKTLEEIFDFVNLEYSSRVRKYAVETLRTPHKRDEFELSPIVNDVFQKTLSDMGY